jgi:hypothetical protein
VRPWVDAWNTNAASTLDPGYILVVDESIFAWTGRNMPGWCVIPRKPKSKGLEGKTLCCGLSRILLRVDMQEGKAAMVDKAFNSKWGKATGCTLRLTQPWHNSGRIVVGDSWFGRVVCAVALWMYGLFCVLNVKGKTSKFYPLAEVRAEVSKETRQFSKMAAVKTVEGKSFDMLAGGHMEKQPMCLISTCETMHPGEDRRFTVFSLDEDGSEQKSIVVYSTTRLHELYRKFFSMVDQNNKCRQEFMHFADIWLTHDWSKRVIGETWGLSAVNTFFTINYFFGMFYPDLHPQSFKEQLAYQMMFNPFLQSALFDRPLSAPKTCELIQLPMSGSKRRVGQHSATHCRYCKRSTQWACEACSDDQHWYGVCRVANRDCWLRHKTGVSPVSASKKRALAALSPN